MALAFEPDFQRFLNDLHRGPGAGGAAPALVGLPPADASRPADATTRGAAVATVAPTTTMAALYRRRRIGVLLALVVGLLAVSSLLGGTGVLQGIVAPAEASGEPMATVVDAQRTHVVQPGDTLWSIVGGLGIDGDLRSAVNAVADTNGGATLAPGQVLNLDAALQ